MRGVAPRGTVGVAGCGGEYHSDSSSPSMAKRIVLGFDVGDISSWVSLWTSYGVTRMNAWTTGKSNRASRPIRQILIIFAFRYWYVSSAIFYSLLFLVQGRSAIYVCVWMHQKSKHIPGIFRSHWRLRHHLCLHFIGRFGPFQRWRGHANLCRSIRRPSIGARAHTCHRLPFHFSPAHTRAHSYSYSNKTG